VVGNIDRKPQVALRKTCGRRKIRLLGCGKKDVRVFKKPDSLQPDSLKKQKCI